MKLRPVDKARYRKHYRVVFAAIVIALITLSIGSSTLFINWLGSPDESHFTLNLAGFVVAVLSVAYTVYRLRDHGEGVKYIPL